MNVITGPNLGQGKGKKEKKEECKHSRSEYDPERVSWFIIVLSPVNR